MSLTDDKLGVRKKVSIVWKYFQKLSKYRVRCNLCLHEQNYQSTTGNILRHLKSKHNIDATQRGQLENANVKEPPKINLPKKWEDTEAEHFTAEDDEFNGSVTTASQVTRPNREREARSKVMSYSEEADDDYYTSSIPYDEYVASIKGTIKGAVPVQKAPPKRKYTAEEDRIIAETEYFREKAAYYRMQKNLTALQAKKIKCELDKLCR